MDRGSMPRVKRKSIPNAPKYVDLSEVSGETDALRHFARHAIEELRSRLRLPSCLLSFRLRASEARDSPPPPSKSKIYFSISFRANLSLLINSNRDYVPVIPTFWWKAEDERTSAFFLALNTRWRRRWLSSGPESTP